ncbi:RrF2 family transcriptional regulator [Jannaschia rubra]|uniref:HTH-type transcriptional repressor NsrR n=1 Tax=Jannaschia rubra TaxID=282197 RepID=A0A0M6XVG0_9RHOB|nr:Rrf2 family transcriptional regulator [Jannaschia rubra]CTQ34768.1 HTH-type transcriptional repressor NsrR [Jannaschia rubra]SFG70201.1 transcriptional regulator, BadM/Rrf2 family [Jannaschia rubra]
MRLTSFTDFGLRALMRMAGEPERDHSTAEMAAEFGISRDHLTKAVALLARGGVLVTRRGHGGGARLARPASEIGLGDVVALLEGGTAMVECDRADGGGCTLTPVCRLRGLLAGAEAAFIETLNTRSLADCALPPRKGADA